MINIFVHKMIMAAFCLWPTEKAECFEKHMEPIIERTDYTHEQVKDWANRFTYLPPNNLIKRSNSQPLINKATYQQ